jgi:hypothetical protein
MIKGRSDKGVWFFIAAGAVFILLCDGFTCGPGFQTESFTYVRNVLLVHTDKVSYASYVVSNLRSTGAFDVVESFDARSQTPTTSLLLSFQAVLVHAVERFYDGTAFGNLLANYWDAGGIVVLGYSAFLEEMVNGVFGLATNRYKLITGTFSSNIGNAALLGYIAEPTSPIMTEVMSLSADNAWRTNVRQTIDPTSVIVAFWNQGQPLAIRGKKNNRNLVNLNLNLAPYEAGERGGNQEYWKGDGTWLIRNAILFSACVQECSPGTYYSSTGSSILPQAWSCD